MFYRNPPPANPSASIWQSRLQKASGGAQSNGQSKTKETTEMERWTQRTDFQFWQTRQTVTATRQFKILEMQSAMHQGMATDNSLRTGSAQPSTPAKRPSKHRRRMG